MKSTIPKKEIQNTPENYEILYTTENEENPKSNVVEVTKEDVSSLCVKETYTNLESKVKSEEGKFNEIKNLEYFNERISEESKQKNELQKDKTSFENNEKQLS
ncbi:hypothetical protein TUBRATIS_008540 [Tubulinosema ratisbonensis]|uniref:Uncharacterized protein n=1 Tax=Tubulinosema ratisbonensis TaxID=291195 RepID=A0A437ANQ5_9MICR|nr:hypothetical protein TUBRATIS_008540 [Tubulinosema ratisbonensis]